MTSRKTMSLQSNPPDENGVKSDKILQPLADFRDDSEEATECSEPGDVLTAIADSDCRTILAVSAEEPVSVSDIVEQCDISTATAYRKVDKLVNAGLLHEQIQIHPYGRNECEYSLRIKTIHVQLTERGVPEARVSLTNESEGDLRRKAITDGGTTQEEESSTYSRLGTLFVDVTGTETLVDEQESDSPDRQLSTDGERSVSEYVSSITKDDGLSDSLPQSESQGQE